jgi:polyisoprenoid-binding protein YceI
MIKAPCIAALALAANAGALAQPAAVLVPAQSEIGFVSTQMGVPVEGHFGKFDAQIALDPKQPATGRVTIDIATASATLGVPETDAELPKPNWFASATFPRASFRSSAIKGLSDGRFEVAGTLTVKGRAQPLVVPVQLTQSAGTSIARGSFTIKRLAFHIGEAEWADTSLVADDVLVRFKFTLTGLPPL